MSKVIPVGLGERWETSKHSLYLTTLQPTLVKDDLHPVKRFIANRHLLCSLCNLRALSIQQYFYRHSFRCVNLKIE